MTEQCGFLCHLIWQQSSHNPEVAGSSPALATGKGPGNGAFLLFEVACWARLLARTLARPDERRFIQVRLSRPAPIIACRQVTPSRRNA